MQTPYLVWNPDLIRVGELSTLRVWLFQVGDGGTVVFFAGVVLYSRVVFCSSTVCQQAPISRKPGCNAELNVPPAIPSLAPLRSHPELSGALPAVWTVTSTRRDNVSCRSLRMRRSSRARVRDIWQHNAAKTL